MGVTSFTDLHVWRKAHEAVLRVYAMTKLFPDDERFGLTSQMRRSAVSIASNIAEGFGRRKALDKARFYTISEGSVEELKYFFILAKDLQYGRDAATEVSLLEEVSRMLRRMVETTVSGVDL